MSRTTVRLAMAALEDQHGLDQNAAFDVLRDVSQRHNVKLRVVAAGMIVPHTGTRSWPAAARPPLPFTVRGRACTNRAEVVTELMRVVISRSGAERGTVQLHDKVHGGLQLEGWCGFSQDFADTFSYVSGEDTPCGHSINNNGAQVVVTDVDSSPLFSESARETLLANNVRSCVSTPIVDNDGAVRGMVSTHQSRRNIIPTEAELGMLRGVAGQCGRWLQWYDHLVLPTVVAAVHEAAAARASGGDPASVADRAVTIADAARLLTDRYGIDKSHSRKMLAAIAHRRGVSLHALAAQLTARIDQPDS
jgi:GAF domain/ANTAR domain